jgi:hypothetical protein
MNTTSPRIEDIDTVKVKINCQECLPGKHEGPFKMPAMPGKYEGPFKNASNAKSLPLFTTGRRKQHKPWHQMTMKRLLPFEDSCSEVFSTLQMESACIVAQNRSSLIKLFFFPLSSN